MNHYFFHRLFPKLLIIIIPDIGKQINIILNIIIICDQLIYDNVNIY